MELKIGERCRVYDVCRTTHAATSDTGEVVGYAAGVIKVHCDNWKNQEDTPYRSGIWFHRRQCRRLKPKKPKAEVKPDIKTQEERWIVVTSLNGLIGAPCESVFRSYAEGSGRGANPLFSPRRYVACPEGSKVVSRSDLAKAWDNWVNPCTELYRAADSPAFPEFCKALGFGSE